MWSNTHESRHVTKVDVRVASDPFSLVLEDGETPGEHIYRPIARKGIAFVLSLLHHRDISRTLTTPKTHLCPIVETHICTMSTREEREGEDSYERDNDPSPVPGDVHDDSYIFDGANNQVPVQSDQTPYDDPMQPPYSNSDQQLGMFPLQLTRNEVNEYSR